MPIIISQEVCVMSDQQEDGKRTELVSRQEHTKIYVKGYAAELLSGCRMLSCFSIKPLNDGLITADMEAVGVVVSFLAVNKILETISL